MINLMLKEQLPDFKFVAVAFAGSNARTYTYKTTLLLEEGDNVVVNAPGGLTVVTVVDPAVEVTELPYPIKWIVSAVDAKAMKIGRSYERMITEGIENEGVTRL